MSAAEHLVPDSALHGVGRLNSDIKEANSVPSQVIASK